MRARGGGEHACGGMGACMQGENMHAAVVVFGAPRVEVFVVNYNIDRTRRARDITTGGGRGDRW